MSDPSASHSPLLDEHLGRLEAASRRAPVLDLACGRGRNGLHLVRHGLAVTFADRDALALAAIDGELASLGACADLTSLGAGASTSSTWCVDLEGEARDPLAGRRFGAVLVFRYLHRPLFRAIEEALLPGGLLVYETFTVRNAAYGRPNNPNFLLREGELAERFAGFRTLHYFEGYLPNPDREIAQIVCEKPLSDAF